MGFPVRLCYLLLIVWNKSGASPLSDTNNIDRIVHTSERDDIRVIHINRKSSTTNFLADFETGLGTIKGKFQKFSERSDVTRDLERFSGSCEVALQNQVNQQSYLDIDVRIQNTTPEKQDKEEHINDIVRDIARSEFGLAEKKLTAMGEYAQIPAIVHKAYGPLETNFCSILIFGKGLSNATQSFQIFKSLVHEMYLNGQPDPLNLMILAQAIRIKVTTQHLDPNAIKADAQAVINGLNNNITTIATNYLAGAMKFNEYQTNSRVHLLAEAVDDYNPRLTDRMMEALIDITYNKIKPDNILANIVSHTRINQAITGIIVLFSKIKNSGLLNKSVVLDLAFHLSKLRNRYDYVKLLPEQLLAVDKVLQDIPSCARNLFFERSVCLWNKEQGAYLYAADPSLNYDKDRRRILVSAVPDNVLFGASWIVEKIGDNILFKNDRFVNEYLYAAEIDHSPGVHYVFNWIPGKNTDIQSAWQIELDGDYCSIRSVHFNEYLYASQATFKNASYVFTSTSDILERDSEMLWQIRSC